MSNTKEILINSLRTNLFMAQNLDNKDLVLQYLKKANKDAAALRQLQTKEETRTILYYKAS